MPCNVSRPPAPPAPGRRPSCPSTPSAPARPASHRPPAPTVTRSSRPPLASRQTETSGRNALHREHPTPPPLARLTPTKAEVLRTTALAETWTPDLAPRAGPGGWPALVPGSGAPETICAPPPCGFRPRSGPGVTGPAAMCCDVISIETRPPTLPQPGRPTRSSPARPWPDAYRAKPLALLPFARLPCSDGAARLRRRTNPPSMRA